VHNFENYQHVGQQRLNGKTTLEGSGTKKFAVFSVSRSNYISCFVEQYNWWGIKERLGCKVLNDSQSVFFPKSYVSIFARKRLSLRRQTKGETSWNQWVKKKKILLKVGAKLIFFQFHFRRKI